MSKKKPVVTIEKTLAEIAVGVRDLRAEGESTDRLVGTVIKGLASLTTRVEELEKRLAEAAADVAELKKPPRTWGQFFRDCI